MLNMYINRLWPSGGIEIKVDGFDRIRYFDCSKRDAIKSYRIKYNLVGKHLCVWDHT